MNPAAPATQTAPLTGTRPSDPIIDIRSLLPELKALLATATNADDEAIIEIWFQLCRTMAFLGPSTDRLGQTPLGATLRTVANAAESVVVIARFLDDDSPHTHVEIKTEAPGGSSQPSNTN